MNIGGNAYVRMVVKDEMSIYVPQTPEQFAEAIELSSATELIIGKHSIAPAQAPLFNAISSIYIMTMRETMVPIEEFYDALMSIRNGVKTLFSRGKAFGYGEMVKDIRTNQYFLRDSKEGQKVEKENEVVPRYYPGRLLFSAVLPDDFYYNENGANIVNGILVDGVLTSKHIGTARKSIVQVLINDYDNDVAADFINDATNISDAFMNNIGMTVGIDDILPQTSQQMTLHKIKEEAKKLGISTEGKSKKQLAEEVEEKGGDVSEEKTLKQELDEIWEETVAEFETLGPVREDPDEEEERVKQINILFSNYNGKTANLANKYMLPESSLRTMLKSGAKGSLQNAQRIFATTGTQTYRGSLPEYNLAEGRTNIYTPKNSLDPMSLGLCRQSFVEGFDVREWLFHAISGREGLSDTATQTAEAGEAYKSLIKSMENLKVTVFGDVRDNNNSVYSFAYPFMPQYMEFTKVKEQNVVSVIDMKRLVGRVNAKKGVDSKGKKLPVVDYKYRELQLPKYDLMKMIDAGKSETFTLKVKNEKGVEIEVKGDYYEPLGEVRKRVAEKRGLPVEDIQLRFKGVELDDTKFMADYTNQLTPDQKLTLATNKGSLALRGFAEGEKRAFTLSERS